MKKFLKILGIIVIVIILCIVFLFIWLSKQPAVKSNYFQDVKTEKALEQKYINKGSYEVSYIEFKADEKKIGKYKIWYPTEMEKTEKSYPLVVMANGTGVKASKYEAVFDHLASFGFIVIGNEDESSWDGYSSSESLDYILSLNIDKTSIFNNKVDSENIGIAGHSQGGVGTINAVTNQGNGHLYKTMYTASATHIALSEALNWPYDVSKIDIPYFMVAGTLKNDAGDGKEGSNNVGIAPLFSLQENYDAISDDVKKIMARRVGADHGDMLTMADGYMTAWFMYQLQNDEDVKNIFIGNSAEILDNANWQDIKKNF
ncbi:MAG: alpha/beta hydrolase [Bacilli bacterium]